MIHLNLTYSTTHASIILIGWGLLLLIGCCWYYHRNKIAIDERIYKLFGRYQAQKSKSGHNSGRDLNSNILATDGDAYKIINMHWSSQFMEFPLKPKNSNLNCKCSTDNVIGQFKAIFNKTLLVQEDEEAFLKDVEYERNLNKPAEKIYANKNFNNSVV